MTSIDPETGEIVPLYHPRKDIWYEHFQLDKGSIESRSPKGRVTTRLLQFNRPDRIEERQIAIQAGTIGSLPP